MQDDENAQNFTNPQSDSSSESVDDTLGTAQSVPDSDLGIEPDENLQGYQDDLGTGDKTDIVQEEQGDQATEFLGVPENELKNEFDKMAPSEQEYAGDEDKEDWREHVEDMDEGDKDRSTDDSWSK